jgi:release factor glutamine methyltransferase
MCKSGTYFQPILDIKFCRFKAEDQQQTENHLRIDNSTIQTAAMLPTPSTSHVCFDTIYEPAEDSYLFLDTLSSSSETKWLFQRFSPPDKISPQPVVVEVGTGSGVVLAFVAANAKTIFGRPDILTLGTDANSNACKATRETVRIALDEKYGLKSQDVQRESEREEEGIPLLAATMTADLCSPFRPGAVDVLIFNPPYVPTPEVPQLPTPSVSDAGVPPSDRASSFERNSHLLSLSYAGGESGMEITNRLLDALPATLNEERGVAYVLLCAQNKPDEVMARIRSWEAGWNVETAGRSGVKAGWERLVILRIWKDASL